MASPGQSWQPSPQGTLVWKESQAEGVVELGERAVVLEKQLGYLSLAGDQGCWGSDSYCFCFLRGGCLRGRSRSLIVSGLESFSRGRQNRKSPLEELKAKRGSNDSTRDLVRSRLRENYSDSKCRSKEALGRHPLQPHNFTEEDAQVQGGEVTGTRPHSRLLS